MRQIKLFGAALALCFISSCSSDDGPSTSGELTGKWLNKETIFAGQTIPYENDNPSCGKDYLQLNADLTAKWVWFTDCNESSDAFTYTRSGNTLKAMYDGEEEDAQIIELTATTLKLKSTYDYDDDGRDDVVIEVFQRLNN